MKINDNLGPDHAASVARDRAIVMRERARPSIPTRDAQFFTGTGGSVAPPQVRMTRPSHPMIYKRPTSDTLLSAETTPRNPNITHRAWGSNIKEGEAEGSFAAGASPEDLNEANRKYWDEMADNNMPTRVEVTPVNDTQAKVQDMQHANDAFWKKQTAHQRAPARQWGKG